jgi:hypothetical protein
MNTEKINLQLSLKTEWFELTKSGIKTEDYREITPYWSKRLLLHKDGSDPKKLFINVFKNKFKSISEYQSWIIASFKSECFNTKTFTTNIMTLGYPKTGDIERILKLEHKGIEIGTGNPDWGAEPDKLYFVIKHGKEKKATVSIW